MPAALTVLTARGSQRDPGVQGTLDTECLLGPCHEGRVGGGRRVVLFPVSEWGGRRAWGGFLQAGLAVTRRAAAALAVEGTPSAPRPRRTGGRGRRGLW